MDNTDKKLLDLVQAAFPLSSRPYADLGEKLGVAEDEVIERLKQLRAERLIRQISPVVDARRLGFRSTLVAVKVARPRLEEAAAVIGQHQGVSHCYERNHEFNLWYTLAVPPDCDVAAEVERMARASGAEAAFELPALKLFKIGVYFAMDGEEQPARAQMPGGELPQEVQLSAGDRTVINAIQNELPLVPTPFAGMAAGAGMEVADFLEGCRSLVERGIVRRFGASLNHRKAGFRANAMTCWAAPPEQVDEMGQRLASLSEVSHCYERRTNPLWRYNLFAMIHAHAEEQCREIAGRMSRETGLDDCVLLFSTREFKKARIKYLV
ncbi:MAG: Lrp/AsnC family transcriptional regulator [Chloroflexi bacterium]|nr:Lrp/AsnC family transcriptional regulator [Chloroflexota bacterium]